MNEITLEGISPQTGSELTSPLSPKRPRTDSTMTNSHSRKDNRPFPEILKSSTSTLQKNVGLVCTTECWEIVNEKPHNQPQDTQLIVTSITKLMTAQAGDPQTASSKVWFTTAERGPLLVKDEQPITETDELSSYRVDNAGGALVESGTSEDTSADTSSHLDCKRLGKSLEDEPPGGCNLADGNDEDGRQVQNSASQIQAFPLSSSDEQVRCQSDCTYDTLHDTSHCNTHSQSADVEESNQMNEEHGFRGSTLFSKEKEEANCSISSNDYAVSKLFYSILQEAPFGNLTDGVKNEGKVSELQICEYENFSVCDWQTKGQVNVNGMSKNSNPSAAECVEGTIGSCDVVLARNIATENVGLESDDFCGAKGERAAGKIIDQAQSETADHTTETPMLARISQEPAEGDNDAAPFSVIDPAIWSETDREAEERRCGSDSTAGVELSPSVKVCKMEKPLPLCCDVRPSQEVSSPNQTWRFNHQSGTQQCKDEKEDLCHSYTEPQACSITTNKTHNKTFNEASYHQKSSPSSSPGKPAKPLPAGDGRQESHTVGHQLKEQDQSGCFPVNLDDTKTQEVEYLQTEIARMDRATEIKQRLEKTSSGEDVRTVEHEKLQNFEENPLRRNEKHKEDRSEISTGDYISGLTEGKISKRGNKLTHIDEECLSHHPHSAVTTTMEWTTEKERTEEASDVRGNRDLLLTSEDGYQQQSQQKGGMTEASPDECVREWTEGNMSNRDNKLTLVTECYAETFIAENKADLLAFTFTPSDAVVPGPHELIHSENADNNPTALNCSDRFSPLPSAFAFCDCVLGGFDTFEKIQLSLEDDGDDDAGFSNNHVLTSLPEQMLKTPQRQLNHSMPETESNEHATVTPEEEEEGEEEEVERFECHTENTANGFFSSDYSCNEIPNFISAADVTALRWPEQQPNSESACNSALCFRDNFNEQLVSSTVSSWNDNPTSAVNDSPKFEMKTQFDMVLKELNLFFEISVNELASSSRASSPEQRGDETDALKGDFSNCKAHLSSPELGRIRETSSDDANDHSLNMCGGDPVVCCTSGSGDGEQEVPLGSPLCQESSVYTAEKHREPREMEQKRQMWSPSFMCRPFLEELSLRSAEQPRRLEPLRTCTRPIRVGLSKRAMIKRLHRPHPYK